MPETNLQVQLQAQDALAGSDTWVNMEQAELPTYDGNVSLSDILGMTAAARARVTAFSYRFSDGAYFSDGGNTINIPIPFYVYPSSLDLNYSLEFLGSGTLSASEVVNVNISKNIIVPMSNKVSLDALIGTASFVWNTPCYNTQGSVVTSPSYSVVGHELIFDNTVFGVLRGDFVYRGYKYVATLQITKTDVTPESQIIGATGARRVIKTQQEHSKISNVLTTILCTYTDTNGVVQEETLELRISQTVLNYLAECPDGSRQGRADGDYGKWIFEDKDDSDIQIRYYNVCDGSSL